MKNVKTAKIGLKILCVMLSKFSFVENIKGVKPTMIGTTQIKVTENKSEKSPLKSDPKTILISSP
jgi:hypothetical protein